MAIDFIHPDTSITTATHASRLIRFVKGFALAAGILTSGCTHVEVDMETGKATVWTFATSRQATDVGKDADGSFHWRSQDSDATSVLSQAILNLTNIVKAGTVAAGG